jgi:hypothetical protein
MGLKISVDMRGLNKLDELSKLAMQEAVKEESEAVLSAAQERCPVLTGALKASLEAEMTGEFSAEVHDGVSYGVHVNFGSKGRSGNPFFSQAFEEGQERFPGRVREWLLWAAKQAAKDAEI